MSASASLFRPLPVPPTNNALDARDRTRLVRSARKLGAVFGATPQLVEPDPLARPATLLPIGAAPSNSRPSTPFSLRTRSDSPASRPSTPGSFYSSSSTNSSMASLALPTPRTSSESLAEPTKGYSSTTRGRRSKELPRPLVLRLNAVPMPPNDRRAGYAHAHAASTDYLNVDVNREMDTLPPTPSTARSASCPPATPTTPVPPTAAELRRKRMAKLTRTLGENVPVDLVFPTAPATASASTSTLAPPSSAATERALPPAPQSAVTAVERARRRRSMSVDVSQAAAAAAVLAAPRNSRIWVTGGSLWTGEWNRRDIREVQNQLRRLR